MIKKIKYILLLRGVNVGGKNKVSMKELKEALELEGFDNVVTYINSGNIIFNSQEDIEVLEEKTVMVLKESFDLEVPVLIIEVSEVIKALEEAPLWWGSGDDSKHNAIFVVRKSSVDEVIKEVGTHKPEYEKVGCSGRIIFWSAPLKTFSRTRWSKIVGQ